MNLEVRRTFVTKSQDSVLASVTTAVGTVRDASRDTVTWLQDVERAIVILEPRADCAIKSAVPAIAKAVSSEFAATSALPIITATLFTAVLVSRIMMSIALWYNHSNLFQTNATRLDPSLWQQLVHVQKYHFNSGPFKTRYCIVQNGHEIGNEFQFLAGPTEVIVTWIYEVKLLHEIFQLQTCISLSGFCKYLIWTSS